MKAEDVAILRDLINKLDLIEEHQHENEKRIKDVRMALVRMLSYTSRQ